MSHFNDQELQAFYQYGIALSGDPDLAWDLLQTALLKYLGHKKKKKTIRDAKAFFKTVLKHTFVDHVRKHGRYQALPFEESHTPDQVSNPEYLHIQKNEVAAYMKRLNPHERELLYLWAVEGMSFSEIAKKVNCPRGTLLAQMHRLKKKLAPLGES